MEGTYLKVDYNHPVTHHEYPAQIDLKLLAFDANVPLGDEMIELKKFKSAKGKGGKGRIQINDQQFIHNDKNKWRHYYKNEKNLPKEKKCNGVAIMLPSCRDIEALRGHTAELCPLLI
uniref:Uncharacterized protein n=1 Tax=Panagrolaimus davidi TaxID=227884 RepID=A0A914QS54_9BILA